MINFKSHSVTSLVDNRSIPRLTVPTIPQRNFAPFGEIQPKKILISPFLSDLTRKPQTFGHRRSISELENAAIRDPYNNIQDESNMKSLLNENSDDILNETNNEFDMNMGRITEDTNDIDIRLGEIKNMLNSKFQWNNQRKKRLISVSSDLSNVIARGSLSLIEENVERSFNKPENTNKDISSLTTREPDRHLLLRPIPSTQLLNDSQSVENFALSSFTDDIFKDDPSNIQFWVKDALIDTYYFYSCEIKPKDTPNEKTTAAIESILRFARTENNRKKLDEDSLNLIFDMIQKHIFHAFPDVSRTYIIGESVSPYYISNWTRLSIIYDLFICFVAEFGQKVDVKLLDRITPLLCSPAKSEQDSALILINKLCENFPEINNSIFQSMSKVVNYFKEGYLNHFCVSPILVFLTSTISKLPMPLDRSYFALFRSVYYPTVVSKNVVDFYNSLIPFAKIFHSKDSTTAVWCIRFLFRHWSVTNSQKQVIFLHQLQCLLASLSTSYLPTLAKALFAKLKQAISSVNFKVSLAALNICRDEAFMNIFASTSPSHVASLIPFIERARKHWNMDVQSAAYDAMKLIESIKVKQAADDSGQRLARKQRYWGIVLNMAAAKDAKVNKAAVKADILRLTA